MYSIQDVSKKTGLTAHTLRYYEKEGLIPGVGRSQGGFRQYTDEDLERLGLICCLKNTGMSIQEIARFVQLTHEGDHTLKERVELLRQHRERVHAAMKERGIRPHRRSESNTFTDQEYEDLFQRMRVTYRIIRNDDEGHWVLFQKNNDAEIMNKDA